MGANRVAGNTLSTPYADPPSLRPFSPPQPQAITWSGAKAPVYISYVMGKDTSSAPIEQFPAQQSDSGSYVW